MGTEKAILRVEQAVYVASLVKLALVILFFASFIWVGPAPAQALDDTKCKGQNLLALLERENPDRYQAVVQAALETKNADAVLWKLEKEGYEPSWLMGTMHLADPQIATLPEPTKQAILDSDQVVIESIEALDPQAAAKAMAALSHLTLLQDGTLRDLIRDDLEGALEQAVSERGMPVELADRLQPWLIATMISLPVCELQRKQSGEKVLDSVVAAFAVNNAKELHGLESVEEQFSAIASLPMTYHVSALEETLSLGSRALDMIETMKILYREQKLGFIFPLMKYAMPAAGSGQGIAQFQEALITRRNRIMFDRSLPLLESGSAFIAVGALHLPGEDGLVELFENAGFRVTPQP